MKDTNDALWDEDRAVSTELASSMDSHIRKVGKKAQIRPPSSVVASKRAGPKYDRLGSPYKDWSLSTIVSTRVYRALPTLVYRCKRSHLLINHVQSNTRR